MLNEEIGAVPVKSKIIQTVNGCVQGKACKVDEQNLKKKIRKQGKEKIENFGQQEKDFLRKFESENTFRIVEDIIAEDINSIGPKGNEIKQIIKQDYTRWDTLTKQKNLLKVKGPRFTTRL